jgi:hypothetical protein
MLRTWLLFVYGVLSLAAVEMRSGPWLLRQADGSLTVGVDVVGGDQEAVAEAVRLVVDGRARAPERVEVLLRPHALPGWSARFRLDAAQQLAGAVALRFRGRSLPLTRLRPPVEGAQLRLAIIHAGAWPTPAGLAAAAAALGGPLDGAVAVGDGLPRVLGTGGWEQELPLWLAAAPDEAPLRALAGVAPVAGVSFPLLALPGIDDPVQGGRIIAAELAPWVLPLLRGPTWDLDRGARERGAELGSLAPLVQAASWRGVPAILQVGPRAGLISDPLIANGPAALRTAPAGVRLVGATASGEQPLGLPAVAAAFVEKPALWAISAERSQLRLVALAADGSATLAELHYDRLRAADPLAPFPRPGAPASAYARAAAGWGLGNGRDLLATGLGVASEGSATIAGLNPVAAMAHLSWLTNDDLVRMTPGSDELRALLPRLAAEPAARGLLRRYIGLEAVLANEWAVVEGVRSDPLLPTLLVLRDLERPTSRLGPWRQRIIAGSSDSELLASILARALRDERRDLLEELAARAAAQAAGTLPMDSDHALQLRLYGAIFGRGWLSPTRLRPIATGLLPRVHPLAKPPIQRFLAGND